MRRHKTRNSMLHQHENYKELIWTLAKTDFTLRYHGSVLGYLWALLKPLFMFTILYFVFSSIFNPRATGNEYYALELLLGIMLFTFFSEGTVAGMNALITKSQLVTKIYVPRWAIIVASTINTTLVFFMNLFVVLVFFAYKQFLPDPRAILLFLLFCFLTYVLILSFSLITAPLYIRFRDLLMIWEVLVAALFYATPIIYSLTIMPVAVQRIILINPMAFIIHFTKTSLIENHYADLWQYLLFVGIVAAFFGVSVLSYRAFSGKIAEQM